MRHRNSDRRNAFDPFGSTLLAIVLAVVGCSALRAQPSVFVVEIKGEVDAGMGPYVERSIAAASSELALDGREGVLLLHVNTFGGRVDIATEIRDAVLGFPGESIAWVDRRAISAGALISIAADRIYMAPGSSIGAATPVTQTGEPAGSKVVSYMRGEMRGTAEENGRNPLIAEAMVDESVVLDSFAEIASSRPLTLSANDAIEVGYADGLASTLDAVLESAGYSEYTLRRFEPNAAESLTGFLSSPIVNSILIMLGMGGLFYAVKTGHFGTGLVVGLASLGLFFGSQYVADLASLVEMVIFVAGVILLIVEIFVIPGFGIAGISGLLLMVTGLFLALIGSFELVTLDNLTDPLYTLAGAFVGFFVLAWAMYRYLPHSSRFRRFSLMGESISGRASTAIDEETAMAIIGREASVTSTLRPAGVISIDGRDFDVVSEEGLIRSGETVVVTRVEGRRIVVARPDSTDEEPADGVSA